MKREREVLPSRIGEYETNYIGSSNNLVFECEACNRKFHSFQALGGHRTSHKKPRLMARDVGKDGKLLLGSPQKPKTHDCSICGLKFATGPSLGGHMRRHKAANLNGNMQNSMTMGGSGISSLDSSPNRMNSGNKRALDFF